MKTARIFVLLVACPLFASNALAQSSHSTEPSVTTVMERYVVPRGLPRPMPQKVLQSAGLDYSVISLNDTNWADVSSGTEHDFNYHVLNTSKDTLKVYVSRTQRQAAGWSSSVCWGTSCYPSSTDSATTTILPSQFALLSLHLIPTLDDAPDSGTVWLRLGIVNSSLSDTTPLMVGGSYMPGNPPLIFQWSDTTLEHTYQGYGNDKLKMTDFLENLAGHSFDYLLTIQDSLPSNWSLTIDDQRNPYSSTGNTDDTIISLGAPFGMASLITNFSAYSDSTYLQPFKFTLATSSVTKEDSAVIYISVNPQTSNHADQAIYRFVMVVQPQSSVAGAPNDRAGLAVTNAWPNPLVGGGALHLEILTDQAGPATAAIYDVTGTQKGTLDLGMLHEGTNELQATAPSLPSGEYIIRVNQGSSASEVVRINYVK